MPEILDNIGLSMEKGLVKILGPPSQTLDTVVGYFNLRGWKLITAAVDRLPAPADRTPKARVLVGMTESPETEMKRLQAHESPQPVTSKTASERRAATGREMTRQLEVGLPNSEDEAALRSLLRQITAGDVQVQVFTEHRLHAKLYLCHRNDPFAPRAAFVGSSNLTGAGLVGQGELNVSVSDGDATLKLADWFEDRWNNELCLDAVPMLKEVIRRSWTSPDPLDPYLVYLKMAYHLSRQAREGLVAYELPQSLTDKLLDFQAIAVKLAARILSQRGGVIIGDVVGLGKTLVATAVARLVQMERGGKALVVCPKNLVEMWQDYVDDHDLHGQVISLSMVTRKLPDLGRHRVVIIDESHHLRTHTRQDYQALKKYIAENEAGVVLLSATPYNKNLTDLWAQLSLFLPADAHLRIRPNVAISAMGETRFAAKCPEGLSTLAAFKRSSEHDDWQALLSQFMVRRTRRYIEENYALTDDEGRRYLTYGDGQRFRFPTRVPETIERKVGKDDPAKKMISDETLDAVDRLRLPRYGMYGYLSKEAQFADHEQPIVADLRKSAQGNLSGLNRVMMFKRLSSSGPAFLATLRRHRLRDSISRYAVRSGQAVPVGSVNNSLWSDAADLEGDGLFDLFTSDAGVSDVYNKLVENPPPTLKWLRPSLFRERFVQDLTSDIQTIELMLARFGDWDQTRDGKIDTLMDIITRRHPDEKVLVFTEYTDTADYVAQALTQRGITGVAAASGNVAKPTRLARRFSPGSYPGGLPHSQPELRVLISTDVLSEGQNLQDARVVVNYDLPWAVVKLVQRAGRVDRIGQVSEEVFVYSLMPAGTLEDEISLRRRILARLRENANLLGSDEQFFGRDEERAIISGLYDEHSDYRLDDEKVDPVSKAYEIWRNAQVNHPELATQVESMPNVVYSTKTDGETAVVVHSQTALGVDAFALVPHRGRPRGISPQEALRLSECTSDTPSTGRLTGHFEMVAQAIRGPLRSAPSEQLMGKQGGVIGKCWRRLSRHRDTLPPNLRYTAADLDEALNDLHEPHDLAFKELAKALDAGVADEDLAALLVQLWRDGFLAKPRHDQEGQARSESRVICSMGLSGLPA